MGKFKIKGRNNTTNLSNKAAGKAKDPEALETGELNSAESREGLHPASQPSGFSLKDAVCGVVDSMAMLDVGWGWSPEEPDSLTILHQDLVRIC